MKRLAIGCSFLVLGLLACGGDESSSGGGNLGGKAGSSGSGTGAGGSTELKLEDVPKAVAEAMCTGVSSCAGPMFQTYLAGSDCVELYTNYVFEGSLAATIEAVEKGTIVYHADKADACISGFGAVACDQTKRAPEVCEEALQGTIAVGGDCTLDAECVGTAYCKVDATCPGKCSPREASGAACSDNDDCQDGFGCLDGKCGKPVADGQPCGKDVGTCAQWSICAGELGATTGTCTATKSLFVGKENDACHLTKGPWCGDGLSCIIDSVSQAGPTMKCVKPAASGAACKIGLPTQCPPANYCAETDISKGDFEGTCKASPVDNEPCDETATCTGQRVCVSGVCKSLKSTGAACASAFECYSANCDKGKCAAGNACSDALSH